MIEINQPKQQAIETLHHICCAAQKVCSQRLDTDNQSVVLIGIVGGAAAGKSTLANYLQHFLIKHLPGYTVSTVSTDSFIFPNHYLQSKQLMQRKGFPESFAWQMLKQFIEQIKSRQQIQYEIPIYSQEKKDVIKQQVQFIKQADIYVIEGINLLFSYIDEQTIFSLRDCLDWGIYLDTDIKLAQQRATARFYAAYEKAKMYPTPYFDSLKHLSASQLAQYVKQLWEKVNLPILNLYLAPHKNSLDIVVNNLPELYNSDADCVMTF